MIRTFRTGPAAIVNPQALVTAFSSSLVSQQNSSGSIIFILYNSHWNNKSTSYILKF
uniref:Uncharacterized protein n=1 Tax=Salmonella sp. 96A-29192 TaxID=1179814 RepID=I3VZP9_9ENTR|nr:hypothetical protein [Salmonella sp. 96A-29192]